MVDVNWEPIVGSALLAIGAVWSLIAGGLAWIRRSKAPAATTVTADPLARSADSGPPPDAVAWVVDIVDAMGMAPESSKLAAILAGLTRDQARAKRIQELETP